MTCCFRGICSSVLVLLVAAGGFSFATPCRADDVRDKITDVYNEFADKARKAREEYEKDLARHARAAISQFERLAAEAVRKGDLAAATAAWQQVLRLDREHEEARAHFKAIGRLDEELKELEGKSSLQTWDEAAKASPNKMVRALEGTVWQWGSNSLMLGPNGATKYTDKSDSRPRVWSVDNAGRLVVTVGGDDLVVLARFEEDGKSYKGTVFRKMDDFSGKRLQ